MEEQQERLDHTSFMTVAADEYSPDCMDPLLDVPPLPLSHPQQSQIQSVYDGDERFLSPILSAAAAAPPTTVYLSMDSGLSGLYHEGTGLPPWGMGGGGREGKPFFTTDVLPMQFPDVEYQKMAVGGYKLGLWEQQGCLAPVKCSAPVKVPGARAVSRWLELGPVQAQLRGR